MRVTLSGIIAGGFVALFLVGLGVLFRTEVVRISGLPMESRVKLSVTVEVDGKTYSGFAVQDFSIRRSGNPRGEGIVNAGHDAEALVVRLPDNAALAVLVDDHNGSGNPFKDMVLSCGERPWNSGPEFFRAIAAFQGPCVLDLTSVPQAVHIPNVASYEGMTLLWENEQETIGIRLISAVLERSTAPLTTGATETFSWLSDGSFPRPYIVLRDADGDGNPIRRGHFASRGTFH